MADDCVCVCEMKAGWVEKRKKFSYAPKTNSLVYQISFAVRPPPHELRRSAAWNYIFAPVILSAVISYVVAHFKSFVSSSYARIKC